MFDVSLFGVVAIFLCAVLTALLWSYGLEIFTKCIKLIIKGTFKVIVLILFGKDKKIEEKKGADQTDATKEKDLAAS